MANNITKVELAVKILDSALSLAKEAVELLEVGYPDFPKKDTIWHQIYYTDMIKELENTTKFSHTMLESLKKEDN